MSRLFWKFFLFTFVAQIIVLAGTASLFWIQFDRQEFEWKERFGRLEQHVGKPPLPAFPPPGFEPHSAGPPPRMPPPPPNPLLPIGILSFVSLVGAALLAWYFSKPINVLRAAFLAAATGDLSQRLGQKMGGRHDELADLGRDFDAMAMRLQALMDAQRRLLHDVSHEMRSPLARLQVAIGLLHKQPDTLHQALERIELESVRMDKLVGELLTLSRMEASVASTREEIDLCELLADLVEDAKFEAHAVGREVGLLAPRELVLTGNAAMLQRAIENVVRNAIRHTPEGFSVEVTLSSDVTTQQAVLSICDAGAGVSESRLEDIFQPFSRGQATGSGDGFGLGLAIARRIVEVHSGTIVANNREHSGLCVEIRLPLHTDWTRNTQAKS